MTISVSISRNTLLCVSFGAALAACAGVAELSPEVANPTGNVDRIVSRLRIGPFYEQAVTESGARFWAARPFYSRLVDPLSETRITDVLWPIGTSHRLHESSWWRAGIAYGTNDDVNDPESPSTWNLFPVWFSGRSRQMEDYWAFFPLYGHLPHTLFVLDDVHFTLFPLYLDYEVNHVRRRYWLWPFFSSHDERPGVERHGLFPFYGSARHKGRDEGDSIEQRYCLWPFWTSGRYNEARNPGTSWMFWPLWGSVSRSNETQRMFLPPFFSYAKTPDTTRWRMPWPLFESVRSPRETRTSFWPFYGDTRRDGERSHYILGPLINWFTLESGGQTTKRFYFFPFYLTQERTFRQKDGTVKLHDRFTRVWPFYANEKKADGSSTTRALELLPIRGAGGFERNWSPFWTLFRRSEQDGVVQIELFWGLIKIRRESRKTEPEKPEEVEPGTPVPGKEETGKVVPLLPPETPLLQNWEYTTP